MKSRTTAEFRRAFSRLPPPIQVQARQAYRRFRDNPAHPGLRFKPVHASLPIFSVRVGIDFRALGRRDGDTMLWFWIGSHADYDRILSRS